MEDSCCDGHGTDEGDDAVAPGASYLVNVGCRIGKCRIGERSRAPGASYERSGARAAAEASDMSAAGGASTASTTGVARTTGFTTRVGGVCNACAMHAVARITRTIMLTV